MRWLKTAVRKALRKWPFRILGIWVENIVMYVREIDCEVVSWLKIMFSGEV
jgi:hypothetical protein